jgi:hypothetical protein
VVEEFIKEAIEASGEASLKNLAPYISSKVNRFVADHALRNLTCQNRMLDFEGLVRDRRILLFHLAKGRFGDYAAGLLASQVVSRIRNAVMKRGAAGAHPFYLYADEFQLFADERFAELLAEARKFGLALTLAHQFVEQLPDSVMKAVLGNVGTVISFRVGPRDGEAIEGIFQPIFDRRDLVSLPNFRACVRNFGRLGETPFTVETLPSSSACDPNLAEQIRESSRKRHGRDRNEVEDEVAATFRGFMDYE